MKIHVCSFLSNNTCNSVGRLSFSFPAFRKSKKNGNNSALGWFWSCSQRTGSVSGNLGLHSQTLTPSSPPLPSGLSAGSWVALADPQRDSLSLHNGAAVTGEGTGPNEHSLPLIDSLVFKSQHSLLGLSFGLLCVLRVEVIVAMSQASASKEDSSQGYRSSLNMGK